ncbi:MAG: SIR2 family protein [Limisphaerales bacterium]
MNALPSIPDELIDSLKKDRCSLFVGAGLSVGAGYPTWVSLLELLIQRATDQAIISAQKQSELLDIAKAPNKWLMVAQELSDLYGRGPFHNELGKIFEETQVQPTKAHEVITQIPFKFVVTTNYDQLIENAYFPLLKRIPKIFTHQDTPDFADALWKQEFFILKAHGDLQKRSSIILTEKDYRTIVYSSPGYRALLAAIFTTKTLLFLGASLSDPEIQLLLRSLHDAFQGSGQYHFALVSNKDFSDTEASHWRKNYNVRCIRYEASQGHPELTGFLESIKSSLGAAQ